MTNLDSVLKSRDITLPTKVHLVKAIDFSSSHVWMWELDYKESWAPKNWCFWTMVLDKTLESPLGCKEIQPVHPRENKSWIFTGRTDADAEAPIRWLLDSREDSLEKTLMLGKTECGTRRGRWRMRGWMASPMWRTWVWISSGSWWWTGRPAMLQSTGSQRVRQNRATELNWYTLEKVVVPIQQKACIKLFQVSQQTTKCNWKNKIALKNGE